MSWRPVARTCRDAVNFFYKIKLKACLPWLLIEGAALIYVLASFASEMRPSMAERWGLGEYEPNRCTSENETSVLDLLSSFPGVITLSRWWMCLVVGPYTEYVLKCLFHAPFCGSHHTAELIHFRQFHFHTICSSGRSGGIIMWI